MQDSIQADASEATIRRIKECVMRIQEMEPTHEEHSGIWQSCVNYLSYMNELSPKSLRNVRLHTELFTGEPFNFLMFVAPGQNPRKYAEKSGYTFAAEDLPEEYWLSEPLIDGWHVNAGRIGCNYDGKIINREIARYQLYVENFISTGMLDNIRKTPEKSVVMEIGAGYGAIGHHLLKMAPGKVCYVVCDLPLILLFSGCYLAVHHPDARVFIYDPENKDHLHLDEKTLLEYDVILMPNHRLSALSALTRVDYAINTFSLAEMRTKQVEEYMDFLVPRLTQYFYFHNYEWAGRDTGIEDLHRFVGKHFMAQPSLDFYDNYIRKTSAHISENYPRTFWFTTSPSVHKALTASTVKLRLPDRTPVRLAFASGRMVVRTRLGHYRPLSYVCTFLASLLTKLMPVPKTLRELVRKELVRAV